MMAYIWSLVILLHGFLNVTTDSVGKSTNWQYNL